MLSLYPNDPLRYLGLLIGGLMFLRSLYGLAKSVLYAFRTYNGYKLLSVRDVTDEAVLLPEAAWELDRDLQLLGMKPLAVLDVRYRGLPPMLEWLYVSPDTYTYAELVQVNPKQPVLVQFSTRFPDDAMLITRYPLGERITLPNYQSRFAASSVEAAYSFHRDSIEAWLPQHGTPLPASTYDEITQHDEVFLRLHRRRDSQRMFRVYLASVALWLVIGTAGLVHAVLSYSEARQVSVSWSLLGVTAIIVVLISQWMMRSIQNPPGAVDATELDFVRSA